MSKTELLERLRNLDEELLLDLLGVTSEELVDAFIDKIIDEEDRFHNYFDE